MKKNIFKEIIIILLLIIAIILILGVLLYEYVPTDKIIPERVSYTTPESVKSEILESTEDLNGEGLNLTYEINSSDLKNYKKVQEYVAGKKNPFSSITEQSTPEETNKINESSVSNNNTTSEKINNNDVEGNKNTTGYLPDKGTK